MHELSIALSLVDLAQEEGERHGGRVSAVHLRLGALSGVVKEALLSSYEMACAETPLEGSTLLIEEVPVVVFCPECRALRTLSGLQAFACAECGTPTPDIRQGKELELVALEVES
jgi:hydrogenase nickel incorporation protein HypA/HybF